MKPSEAKSNNLVEYDQVRNTVI